MADQKNIPDLWDVIEKAGVDELRLFLWKQAQRSSALSIKLRAALIEGVETEGDVNKYSQVLTLLVHHNIHGVVRLTKRSIQLLRDVTQHFVELQQKYLLSGELRESWLAGHAVISALHLLMDKYHGPEQKLVAILAECYQNIQALFLHRPAPELKELITNSLLSLLQRKHHTIYDLRYNAATTIMLASSTDGAYQNIAEVITNKLANIDTSQSQYNYWAALLVKIPDNNASLKRFIRAESAFDIAYLLQTSNDSSALRRLILLFDPMIAPSLLAGHGVGEVERVPHVLSQAQNHQWSRWRFESALAHGTPDEVQKSALYLLTSSQNMATYHTIKSATSSNAIDFDLASEQLSDSLRAAIYIAEARWNELTTLLSKSIDIALLINHLEALIEHVDQPFHTIQAVTDAYLENHGGPQVYEFISALLHELRHLKQEGIAHDLIEHLHHQFPGRFDDLSTGKGKRRSKKSQTPGEDIVVSGLLDDI